jgi:non-ribosomal peptide synthetase component F
VETRKLIGYFNNLMFLRTSLHNNPTFRELIGRVSRVMVGAFEHQDVPLQQIADTLNIPGSVLTRAMFALQNVPIQPREMAGVKITPLDMPEGISNFDLFLSMKINNGHLLGVLRYKTDLFHATTMTRLLENFQHLLATVTANPELRLAELPRFAEHSTTHYPNRAATEVAYVAPETELEHTIAAIWQEVLHQERISVEANFFELGGRSLDLVQMGNKVQTALKREIPLRELFQHPTIRLLAQYVHKQHHTDQAFARQTQHRTHHKLEALKRQQQMQRRRKSDG